MTPPFAFTLSPLATTAYALLHTCNRARVAEAEVKRLSSQAVDLITKRVGGTGE